MFYRRHPFQNGSVIQDGRWRGSRHVRRRESTPTTGAPVLVQSQGRLLREGAGAGPDNGRPDHTPDPDPGDPGGDLDLGDLAPG